MIRKFGKLLLAATLELGGGARIGPLLPTDTRGMARQGRVSQAR